MSSSPTFHASEAFVNEPFLDFSLPESKVKMQHALNSVDAQMGQEYPLTIGSEQLTTEFEVGNLYFNRKCTRAMVGAHPFGGFNMSGTDSKAGGPDYLLLFAQAKSITEKALTGGRLSPTTLDRVQS
jgi:delta 1-pyrroline-5-carboxylate dehydrogenase